MKYKEAFEDTQKRFAYIEDQFKEASYQLKLAEMKLHRKMFEHLIKKSHHIIKDICGDDMNFEFCPNYTAERNKNYESDEDHYGLSYYNSGILLNKKNIETTQSADFMAFWITKVENWDDECCWWNCEIELSQFKPSKFINNEGHMIHVNEPVNINLKTMLDSNQTIWNKLYIDNKRNSVTEELDFRFAVRDEGDSEYTGDRKIVDILKRLYERYKLSKFDKYPYEIELSYEK